FWLATQFIFSSLEYWFSHQVEQSLEQSVSLAREYLDQGGNDLVGDFRRFRREVVSLPGGDDLPAGRPERLNTDLLEKYHLNSIYLYDGAGRLRWQLSGEDMPEPDGLSPRDILGRTDEKSAVLASFSSDGKREGLIARAHLPPPGGELICVRLLPEQITGKLSAISSGYEDYLQLKMLHNPLRRSHFITFSIVTLLTIFAAIWFGFFLAKSITVPIQSLVSATQSIAEGDLDVQVETDRQDEVGMLITSFNDMVRDLKESRESLGEAYAALQQNHEELEDRRRYMEIVLKNIAAGVVSVDAAGKIMTMNKSAEDVFELHAEEARGRIYSQFLDRSHLEIVSSFVDAYAASRQPYLEQQVRVLIGNRPMVLLIKASILIDDNEDFMGVVVVLDDLTELEKAQRMAAWREVARRIAHEIKNPLTPIQLSTQRLRRKFPALLEAEGSIFDECTRTIIQQVDHMKHLVNEFSKFARLPRAQLSECNLAEIVEDALALYRHTRPEVKFRLEHACALPRLKLDPDQFKQVMLNLFDNALHALGDGGGEITVRLFYDPVLKIARMECADTGHGISDDDKLRVFEPYYSTRKKGTGLGLAIVSNIIEDHNGFVRVRDNSPRGTVIVIELPG
ncbi:MAG: ATP-binding protein, partial [Syntrophobacteraceae bacterium]